MGRSFFLSVELSRFVVLLKVLFKVNPSLYFVLLGFCAFLGVYLFMKTLRISLHIFLLSWWPDEVNDDDNEVGMISLGKCRGIWVAVSYPRMGAKVGDSSSMALNAPSPRS